MKLLISIVLLCILPAILCNPRTTRQPRTGTRRTTVISNSESGNDHHSGAIRRVGTTRRRTTIRRSTTHNSNAVEGNELLPVEILLSLFDCMSINDLPNVRGVCKFWRDVVNTKTLPEKVESLSELRIPRNGEFKLQDYLAIYNIVSPQNNLWENAYNQHLPGCVNPNHKHYNQNENNKPVCWTIVPVEKIIEVPNRAPKPHNYVKRSFVQAFPMERQVIKLIELGLPRAYLDLMQPKIEIREWAQHSEYINLAGSPHTMKVKITLLTSANKKLGSYELSFINKVSHSEKWEEKILTLENYGRGVRKIRFERELNTMRAGSDIFIPKPTRTVRTSRNQH